MDPSMVMPLTLATSLKIWLRSELFAVTVRIPFSRITVAGLGATSEEDPGLCIFVARGFPRCALSVALSFGAGDVEVVRGRA